MPTQNLDSDTEQKLNTLILDKNFDEALRIVNDYKASSISNLKILLLCATVYREIDNKLKALEFSAQAYVLKPNNKSMAMIYANDLLLQGRLEESEKSLRTVDSIRQTDVDLLYLKSKILYQQKNYAAASKILVAITKRSPQLAIAHLDLAHALLMQEKWKAGWEEYEWRYKLPSTKNLLPQFKMPLWDGTKNLEHVLLIADQGYGDCFQFSRYIPLVAQRCKKITLMRSKPLARLFDSIPITSTNLSEWNKTPLTSAYATLSSLPRIFQTRSNNIPTHANLIKADQQDILRWKNKVSKDRKGIKLRIGVAWSGRVDFSTNYLRAMKLSDFEKLLDIPKIEFYSLQVGSPASESKNKNIIDLSEELSDFAETAAAMEALDLIITTDTSVAHLAGTLGRPTWLMLSYSPDWRWGAEGNKSLWYSTMRLFRQDSNKNWTNVVNECETLLRSIVKSKDAKNEILNTITNA